MLERLTLSQVALAAALLGVACSDTPPATPTVSAGGAAAGVSGSAVVGGSSGAAGSTATLGGAGASGAVAMVAGSGGAGTPSVGGGQSGAAGSAAGEPNLSELAQAFQGFRMDLACDHPQESPCEPQNSATPNRGYLCCYVDETIERKNKPPVDVLLGFAGDAAKIYDVELRIRGVVENHDYGAQGTKQGAWVLVGGTLPEPGAIHVFGATVSDPQQTYFFNSWNDKNSPDRLIAVDYLVTLPMRGGTQVRLFEYDDIGKIWANAGALKIEGLPPYPDAFDGQFLQLDVVSVKPREL